jgi:hypothetical protein
MSRAIELCSLVLLVASWRPGCTKSSIQMSREIESCSLDLLVASCRPGRKKSLILNFQGDRIVQPGPPGGQLATRLQEIMQPGSPGGQPATRLHEIIDSRRPGRENRATWFSWWPAGDQVA